MNLSEIKKETDLKRLPILEVLNKIPSLYSGVICDIDDIMDLYIHKKAEYEGVMSDRLKYYQSEANEDIFQMFKTKEDREIIIRNSTERLIVLRKEMQQMKRKMDTSERCIVFLKELEKNIRSIVDYEKFRAGK